ncbi:MAG: cyclase family protein [Myxococcota bacterium]
MLTGTLDAQTVREWENRYSNSGRWEADDRLGVLNFITRERVRTACAIPRRGHVLSCALDPDGDGPGNGSLRCRTRWDEALADSNDPIRFGVVGRGVLLDISRMLRRPWLDDGTRIRPDDLDTCAENQGVTVESGDILLIRTGMMTRCRKQKSWQGYVDGPAPGLSVHCARWLFEREIVAVATDTWGVEVRPHETPDCAQPLHAISLRHTGVLFGENFDLDPLARACSADGNYDFLFTAPPVIGAVDSSIHPLAIR